VTITNLVVTHLVRPRRIPRLDFSGGIPEENTTLVAVPILLFTEEQVRQAARDLEIRYLANRDPHLHFALVTDLPDSVEESDGKDTLARLCASLVEGLNKKYASRKLGSFFHLHRRRTYNETERIWMGWERKRGKILDLNNLILNRADHFPLKVGDLSTLQRVRFVITVDQDSQLPRETARVLAGALAHPLNRAVIDPGTNQVVEGYTILQPRVGISFQAGNRTRMAAICSGETGFDIYTHAVSDVYQDLFGDGIFTGKGIYEVAVFQQVIDGRFPCNSILSHDLIEGEHARTGLITDVEIVDDYPSSVSSYSRRKHRWVRGDWQILLWLFPRVPDASGSMVRNPLRLISRWKILDNLRRSLTECASFLLLLVIWTLLPGRPLYWTAIVLTVFSLPILLQLMAAVLRAGPRIFTATFWETTGAGLVDRFSNFAYRMMLLFHQSLVTVDAVIRSVVRMGVTRRKLLEWETSAQSESRHAKEGVVEFYLNYT
ncbi:MAG: glucoamylase family protein, partial [Candidatus Acidiferrales bacterium]